ncbi:hypothetical protein [Nocardia mexicana]|uniref:Uncharacterized protein n=1 Tax=Nocardia mexicana TaxID=279262 RepID=A0A370H9D9_9NOCA|nr:hypothetical protein [Nocardia mexicana]RDI53287.1 hypothetical protein DFR68_103675 [Nocardia mexicana]
MNAIATIASTGVAATAIPCVPASRGVLASQGTGLPVVRILGVEAIRGAAAPAAPTHAIAPIMTDKHEWGWHLAFADASANAFANAYATDDKPVDMAVRLRRTDPATVFRDRHRSRHR